MMKRIAVALFGTCLALAAFAAHAQRADQVETGMVVSGWVEIAPDGSVSRFMLKQDKEMAPAAIALVSRTVPRWNFVPVLVDGKPVTARARMQLRLVASQRDDGNYDVKIDSAWFGDDIDLGVKARERVAPDYPRSARRAGVTGSVYAVMRVGADGRVVDAAVERVNLRMLAPKKVMERGRELLGDATLEALRQWVFEVPAADSPQARPSWDVRMVVDFQMEGDRVAGYGEWSSYVPGPYQRAPWLEAGTAAPSDALVAGALYPVDAGPRLRTALDPAG